MGGARPPLQPPPNFRQASETSKHRRLGTFSAAPRARTNRRGWVRPPVPRRFIRLHGRIAHSLVRTTHAWKMTVHTRGPRREVHRGGCVRHASENYGSWHVAAHASRPIWARRARSPAGAPRALSTWRKGPSHTYYSCPSWPGWPPPGCRRGPRLLHAPASQTRGRIDSERASAKTIRRICKFDTFYSSRHKSTELRQ